MFGFRSIGKILRGNATPLQLAMACILGAMIGFVPGFMQGPGAIVALLLLLVMLNANLGLAALVMALAKLLSLVSLPVSFEVGRLLLDGPTQPLFKSMINAPVLALFGFEHYATTGGLALGLVVGVVAAIIVNSIVGGFRKTMAGLEENSERFHKISASPWIKLMTFVFVGGGKGKATYADLISRRFGNPIRLLGVVFALLVGVLVWVGYSFFSGPILTVAMKRGLEQANGATVDLQSAKLDLKAGKLTVSGLAMADPAQLDTDLFRARTLEADVSGADLLRKRVSLDRAVFNEASHGEVRKVPGELVGRAPQPSPPPPPEGGGKTIDDYIAQAKQWKERLAQARKWIEEASGKTKEGAPGAPPAKETLKDRLKREAAQLGYARVRATHLIEGAPTFLVRSLEATGVKVAQLEGEVLDIRGANLSTHPGLVPGAPSLEIRSRSGNILADLSLGSLAAPSAAPLPSTIALAYKGLPGDVLAGQLKLVEGLTGGAPVQGGTIDAELRGTLSLSPVPSIDLPMHVVLRDSIISVPGAGSAPVSELRLPIGLRGPIDNPRITIDDKQFADALVQAGAGVLVDRATQEAQKAVDKVVDKAKDELLDKVGDKLGGEAGKQIGEQAGEALKGLFPGKKKEEPKKP